MDGVTGEQSDPPRRGTDDRRRPRGAGLVDTAVEDRGAAAGRGHRASRAYSLLPFSFDAALQVLVVGSGASLGREVAPRQFAVALGNFATGWLKRLRTVTARSCWPARPAPGWVRCMRCHSVVRCSPLRIMLKSWHPRAVGAALITSSLAVAVSSFVTHDQPNLHWPNPDVSYRLIGYALVLAPLALVIGLAFNRIMGSAGQRER